MRTPTHLLVAGLLLGLGTVACGQDAPPEVPPDVSEVFEQLLLPPNPEFVSRSGSRDALRIVLRSTESRDDVLAFYRQALAGGNWRVVSDRPDAAGEQVIYAERNQRPLWIRVAAEGTGSRVELAGAVVKLHRDSTRMGAGAPPPASTDD